MGVYEQACRILVLEARARTPEVARRIIATVRHYNEIANSQGIDIVGTNPTPDNMAGGLTTIEEKSLGALAKTGNRPIEGVLAYGEKPSGPGLWFMDAPAAAVENLTAIAAAGAQVNFPTGVAVDFAGNLYLADPSNQRVRRIGGAGDLVLSLTGAAAAVNLGDQLTETLTVTNTGAGLASGNGCRLESAKA